MGVSVAGTSGRHLVMGMTVAAYTDEETPHGRTAQPAGAAWIHRTFGSLAKCEGGGRRCIDAALVLHHCFAPQREMRLRVYAMCCVHSDAMACVPARPLYRPRV